MNAKVGVQFGWFDTVPLAEDEIVISKHKVGDGRTLGSNFDTMDLGVNLSPVEKFN